MSAPKRTREDRSQKTRAWLRKLLRDWRHGRRTADECMTAIAQRLDQPEGGAE
ncbi:hypothetical protein [Aliihoeflea sp. PC F10.4]